MKEIKAKLPVDVSNQAINLIGIEGRSLGCICACNQTTHNKIHNQAHHCYCRFNVINESNLK